MKHTRFWAALALCLAVVLAGCGRAGSSFTWYVEAVPKNLDPQVASSGEDVTACANLYATLMRTGADGELENGCITGYTVSEDGLTYTFTLRPDLAYRGRRGAESRYTLTAGDFVFAFRRIYTAATGSPYTETYSAIANSGEVLAGELPVARLGVKALDAATLRITLSRRDDAFLQKLAQPGAAPCNKAFFESTQGAYGLTMNTTLASGSFYLYNWTSSGLFLRREADGEQITNLRLVIDNSGRQMGLAQVERGDCDAALDDTFAETELSGLVYTDTVWCLVFNQRNEALENPLLRAALACTALEADLSALTDGPRYEAARGLVAREAVVNGKNYRVMVGTQRVPRQDAWACYTAALAELSVQQVSQCTLLVPEEMLETAQQINSRWQKQLSLFIRVETVPLEELEPRLAAGEYTIALMPLRLTGADPLPLLQRFGEGGLCGHATEDYTELLTGAADSNGGARLALCRALERSLLASYTAVPVVAQNRRLVVSEGIEGLIFSPFGPVLDLTDTIRHSKKLSS